jgi:putative ABC transport system substrate-binding protein
VKAVRQHLIRATTRRAVLAGMAAALARGVRAQQREEKRRIGALMATSANDPEGQAEGGALAQGLGVLGWREGGNLHIDWRWASGDPTLYERYAAELVALGPQVLFANGSPEIVALRRVNSTIPIVFARVTDPVGQGFVESLAHPGGNNTGFSIYDPRMAGKWLQMLTEITPPVAHAAVLYDPTTSPFAGLVLHAIEEAAPSLGVAVQAAPCRDDAEIETTMAKVAQQDRGGLLVMEGAFAVAHRDAIVALAARYRLPAIYPLRFFTVAGGLMSYGIDPTDSFRRAADYVDRILKGAKPRDLPVQQPTKFELVINLKTAKALDVTIATPLLATADEVIE